MSGAVPAIPRRTFPSANGGVLARGLVYTYIAGTSTIATTWQDIAMSIPNTNPILLDTTGSCTLWTDPALTYKFVVQNAGGVLQYTLDNVLGSGQSPTLQQSHVDTFSGNGVNKIFTLSAAPASINDTNVYIAGAYMEKSSYTLSGTTLTFVTAPTLGGSNIEVTYYVLLDFTGLAATIAGYSAAASASASDAQTSALAASTSETNAAGSVTAINNRIYPGTYTVAPTTRPDGSARQSGDEYFDATANKRYTYNGATWVASDINTANLAAPSGSSLVGDGTTTVADRLSAINLASYTALRAYAGANQSAYITGYLVSANPSGIAGLFTRDDSDTTTADNGGTVIVAANGKRWKRVYAGQVNVLWFGAKGDWNGTTGTDDTAAIQAALNASAAFATAPLFQQSLPPVYFPVTTTGLYKISSTLTKASGVSLIAEHITGAEKTAIFCSTDAPILTITGKQRNTISNLMFLGDKTGNKSGGGGTNSQPLVTLTGDTSLTLFDNCDFRRGSIGVQDNCGIWIKFRNCQFYANATAYSAPAGVDSVHFHECDIENNATAFDVAVSATGLGHFVVERCYFEKVGGNPQVWSLRCAKPIITSNRLLNNVVSFGKGVACPVIRGNSVLTYPSVIGTPPLFTIDSLPTDFAVPSAKKFGNGPVLALNQSNHMSGNGYVAGDGLDYVFATNVSLINAGTQAANIQFMVDAGVISQDALSVVKHTDQYGNGAEFTTFGVVANTGAAISATALSAATFRQFTALYQSLLKGGTFPAGSVATWEIQGSIATGTSGPYLTISNPGPTAGNFAYNRIIHVPTNCRQLYAMARVKAGTIGNGQLLYGGISSLAQYHTVQSNYFDNGDGTFDDLVSLCVPLEPGKTVAKRGISVGTVVGAATIYLRWICAIPVVDQGRPAYAGTFTYNAPSIAAGATITTNVMGDTDTANDLKMCNIGDAVRIIPMLDTLGVQCTGYISATGQLTIRFTNPTSAAIDLASGVYRWEVTKQ